MKKLNLVCASIALAFGASAATAGTLATAVTGGTVFATENFGGSTSAATDAITMGAVTYSMSTITAVNAGATVYFTIRLNGGKFVAAPVFGDIKFAGAATAAAPGVGVAGASAVLSTDKTTALVTIVNGTTSATLGLGAFTWTPSAGSVNTVNTTLAAAGGTVTATVGLTTVAPAAYEATDALTTVDAPLPTVTAAVSAAAEGGAVSASMLTGTAPYAGKIDLTATPVANAYAGVGSEGKVALGKITFTDVTGTQNLRAGGEYALATTNGGANTGMTATVTPGAGQSFPIGSVLTLNTATDCQAATNVVTTGTGTVAFTAATAGTAKTLVTAVAVTTGTPWYVCMTKPSGTNVATPITPTISAVVAPFSTTDLIATASGTGYALTYNGSQIDVNAYWPAGLSAYGYMGYVRVMNTGAVGSTVSAAQINSSTGAVGAAGVITLPAPFVGNVLPAGASVMLPSATIEAAAGAPAVTTTAQRLRLTASTTALRAQSFVQVSNTPPQETSSAQNSQ